MNTIPRTEVQLELEAHSVQLGITQYRKSLEGGYGEVSAGQQLIKAAIRPMEEALVAWLAETAKGLASRSAGTFYFLNQLDPVALSWITAQTTISLLQERPALTKVAIQVALQIEASINLDALAAASPDLAFKVQKQLSRMNNEKNRLVFIRKGQAMVDVKTIQWADKERARVGTLLIAMFAQATGLVAIEDLAVIRGKTPKIVRPTESCLKWLEVSNARCALLNPTRLPMVCRPRHWSSPFNGGYLTKALRQPMVKTRNKGYLMELREWDMPLVYASVNALQDTEWAVNEAVFGVIKALHESNRTDGGLPAREEEPLPAKPWREGEEPDPALLHAWKVDAARTHEANAKSESKRLQLIQKIWGAEMMLERGNSFHYVYNLDWRGRMYPVGSGMNPQGDDVAKAMLRFAKSEPLGEEGSYWLAIHGSNSFGVDKVSFDERIDWVQEHTDDILDSAANPTNGRMLWAEADSPYTFLAFCMEWAKLQRWVDAGLDQALFQSSLPVAFDGSCNGLQNFSAMLRDPVGGAATGLIPSEKPADIYTEVANAAQAVIDADAAGGNLTAQRWVGKMTRKLAKRNTMTVPYGVTRRGMRDQLFGELKDSDPEFRAADADYLAACNHTAIGNVVVAARLAMDWLKEAAKVATHALTKVEEVTWVDGVRTVTLKEGKGLPVRWESPMGLLVVQDYRVAEGDAVDFVVLGQRYQLLLARTGDKLNTRKQSLGISPNFVHSLDAAHLMRTVLFCAEDGMVDFAMIHDSYGCHAGRAALLRDNLRDAFVAQYSEPVLEKFREALLEQLPEDLRHELPELPPMGTLDLELVKKSEYFFA
jgi:DNA-directed RNA polymerase